MPVAHLGLTVSHIPSATSFYLQALQPLGYHYIGQSGDSIGLGVHEADLFLTQEPNGLSVSPTHIAFSANSRATVRDCYSAALSAGGYPSGAPNYRNKDCTAFNAAAEDLDGNVIEFVYRERSVHGRDNDEELAPSENGRVITWQKDVASSTLDNDTQSLSSRISRTKSRGQTALDLVSSTSRSVRSLSEAPVSGSYRGQAAPTAPTSEFPTKALLGTLLGAAAGVAVAFAMTKSEDENAKSEAAFFASTASRAANRTKSVSREPMMMSHEPLEYGDVGITKSQGTRASKSHRNYSVTETTDSRRYPPRSMLRTIQPTGYGDQDDEVREVISQYTASRRPSAPLRSKTIDAIEYVPTSQAGRSSRHTIAKRSATLPLSRPEYDLEALPELMYTSTASHHSTRQLKYDKDLDISRRDSGISMSSHRSKQDPAKGSGHAGRRSSASTVRSARQYESAVDVPLPTSKAPSHRSASTVRPLPREDSHHQSAAGVALPASRAPSHISGRSGSTVKPLRREKTHRDSVTAPSHIPASQVPIPESHGGGWDSEDSNGMSDSRTVVPSDSISCVGLSPQPKARKAGSHKSSSRHSGRRSEAAESSEHTARLFRTENARRHSAVTLPVRSKEEYHGAEKRDKRTVLSHVW